MGPDRGRHRGERRARGRVADGSVATRSLRAGDDDHPCGPEALDRLEPLWLVLHHHHQEVGGERLGPYVDDDDSWRARRALYCEVLANGGFVLLAERGGELVGYATVAITPVGETLMPDTWRTGDRLAEIETLCVAPARARRGRRLRAAGPDRRGARAAGVHDVMIGAFVTNDGRDPALRAARLPPRMALHAAARGRSA